MLNVLYFMIIVQTSKCELVGKLANHGQVEANLTKKK